MKKLFSALRQGNMDEVKCLIEKKPELINCVAGPLPKKDHGQSLLQVALKTGHYEIADYLIQAGADVNKLVSNGYDAINWAIHRAELIMNRPNAYPDSQEMVRKQLENISIYSRFGTRS